MWKLYAVLENQRCNSGVWSGTDLVQTLLMPYFTTLCQTPWGKESRGKSELKTTVKNWTWIHCRSHYKAAVGS